MPHPAIAVEGLRFEYPGTLALDEVSFEVARGSVTALVGPNGAGKTTLLRCLAGLERPMLGAVHLAGVDVLEEPRLAHRKVGFLPDFYGLYDALSVRQCLMHAAAANGVVPAELPATVERAAQRLDIDARLDSRAGELSRGQRQRVAIAQAMVHAPEVLLLDEPASGLDPEARHALAQLLTGLRAEGITLVVSSHILAELDEYSTHMLVLRAGRVIENRALHGPSPAVRRIRLELAVAVPGLRARLDALDGASVVQSDERSAVIEVPADATHQAQLLARMVTAGLPVCAFSELREDLQVSYLRTVRSDAEGAKR
jgi:ABC-2 type transport system ATP-binding protein